MIRALLLLAACSSATEVVVVVRTEGVAIPQQLDKVRLVVVNTLASSPDLPLCSGASSSCLTLPMVATLIPGPDHPSDVVTVQVTGYLQDQAAIADAASFVFQSGQRERLDFVLSPACLDRLDCAATTQACGSDGKCVTLALTPLGDNPSFDGGFSVGDLGGGDLGKPDLAASDDLAARDLSVGDDLRSLPDLLMPDLTNSSFAGALCVSANAIVASASFPASTCSAYCQNLGLTCSDSLCTTNRGIGTFGVEAWVDSASCTLYQTSSGQANCLDDLSAFSSPSVAKYRCCCR